MHILKGLTIFIMLVCITPALVNCAPVISREGLQRVDQDLTLPELKQEAEEHLQETVLLGGTILETENYPEKSLLTVIQYPLGSRYRPDLDKSSEGRFMIVSREFLDPAIYSPGRKLTVLGTITGQKTRPVDKIIYTYPVLEASEMHLWPERDPGPARSAFQFGVGVGIGF